MVLDAVLPKVVSKKGYAPGHVARRRVETARVLSVR
jgi:hypothetical protein